MSTFAAIPKVFRLIAVLALFFGIVFFAGDGAVPGGRVIVLSPAHQWLFTPFDAAIGHFRRYTRAMLKSIQPTSLQLESCWYLDSVGMAASAANLWFLKQSMPTQQQLHFWDTFLVPPSRILDPVCLHSVGKTVVAVWRKAG